MRLKDYKPADLTEVCSLHERSSEFPLPALDAPLYLAKTIVEEGGKVIGFGCLKLTSEAIIIVDKDMSTRLRALALKELITTGIYKCQKLGLTEMHAFLTGSNQGNFEQVLKKNFGFIGHTGNVLVLDV